VKRKADRDSGVSDSQVKKRKSNGSEFSPETPAPSSVRHDNSSPTAIDDKASKTTPVRIPDIAPVAATLVHEVIDMTQMPDSGVSGSRFVFATLIYHSWSACSLLYLVTTRNRKQYWRISATATLQQSANISRTTIWTRAKLQWTWHSWFEHRSESTGFQAAIG
jgi:hypothetical protein